VKKIVYDICLPQFMLKDYTKIKINSDNDGRLGNSNDITLYNGDDKSLGISIKNNNLSIKHPRAGSLSKLFKNSDYNKKYNNLNDSWYNGFVKSDIEKFNECEKSSKMDMYNDFVQLLVQELSKYESNIINIINFCVSIYTDYILLKCKNRIRCYKNTIIHSKNFNVVKKSPNTFLIITDSYTIKFRLHTASSKVTKKLSLKYDVSYEISPLKLL
jgi:hypothetical protein